MPLHQCLRNLAWLLTGEFYQVYRSLTALEVLAPLLSLAMGDQWALGVPAQVTHLG